MTQQIVQLFTILFIVCIAAVAHSQIMNNQLETGTASSQFVVTEGASPFNREFVDASNINVSIFNNDADYLTANQTITLSGDVTGSGSTSITTDIASGVVGTTELTDNGVKLVDVDYSNIFTNSTTDNTFLSTNYFLYSEDGGTLTGGLKNGTLGNLANFMETEMSNVNPAGGSSGQVLTKNSATDYDYSWATPSGGGGGVTSIESKGTTGGSITFDFTTNRLITITLNATSTFTFTNGSSGTALQGTLFIQSQGAAISWPANVKFPGGVAPVLSDSGVDIVNFEWNGNNWIMTNAAFDLQ